MELVTSILTILALGILVLIVLKLISEAVRKTIRAIRVTRVLMSTFDRKEVIANVGVLQWYSTWWSTFFTEFNSLEYEVATFRGITVSWDGKTVTKSPN